MRFRCDGANVMLLPRWATIPGVSVSPRSIRRLALGTAVAAMIALTACAGGDDPETTEPASPDPSASASASASPSPSISPSPDLSAVTVSDAEPPVVTVPAPWGIASTQTKVLKEGGSQKVGEDATVTINYIGVNGTTGDVFDSSYERGSAATFALDEVITGFKLGLTGQSVGSQVLIGMPSSDGYPEGTSTGSISPGDSLVFFVEILSASFDEATGEVVTPEAGLPSVTVTDDGPTISIPEGATAPSELVVQPLIKGPGAAVTAESSIEVKYRSWVFADGSLFEDAWVAQTGQLDNLIEGWKQGLVGQTSGSRVLLIVTPAQAYPDGVPTATPSLAAGQTLVYVIDILDVQG